jgi:uncharacterized protein YjbJ (UPF0337 family)
MNQDRILGICKQFEGKVKTLTGKLTNNQLAVNAGARDQRVGRMQERYGVSKDEAARQLRDFVDRNRDWRLTNR